MTIRSGPNDPQRIVRAGGQLVDVVDLFAGPGGWSEAVIALGLLEEGIEWDEAACLTAEAAGHLRTRADVSETDPGTVSEWVTGLIASPPCTLFSSAGRGTGRQVLEILTRGIMAAFAGEDTRKQVRADIFPVALAEQKAANEARSLKRPEKRWSDEKVEKAALHDAFLCCLIIEPARFVAASKPVWVALEQVPAVLPLWRVYVICLRQAGYSAWAGVLNSADYGVPQTRERAICIASRTRPALPPAPTHSRDGGGDDLFGDGRAKWVSMAAALGWSDTDVIRPARGQGISERHGNRPDFPATDPAPTVITKARSWGRIRTENGRWFVSAGEERPKEVDSVRVTVQEAGILQSFRSDYPWQGSRSKQYEQVGNATPPVLAAAVLSQVAERPSTGRCGCGYTITTTNGRAAALGLAKHGCKAAMHGTRKAPK